MLSFVLQVPCAHVEAGLRTHNLAHPFPEEFNRKTIAVTADMNFAPSTLAATALKREGVPEQLRAKQRLNKSLSSLFFNSMLCLFRSVFVVGNTVIDAVTEIAKLPTSAKTDEIMSQVRTSKMILLTGVTFCFAVCWALFKIAFISNSFCEQLTDVRISVKE